MIVRCPSACGSSTGASGFGAPPPWLIGLAGSSGASILSGGKTSSTSGVRGGVSSSPSSSVIRSFGPVTLLTGFGVSRVYAVPHVWQLVVAPCVCPLYSALTYRSVPLTFFEDCDNPATDKWYQQSS